jgi:hypothetical protein
METVVTILTLIGLACVICTLLLAVWIVVAGQREDEHWPVGLDSDPTLDVQSHIGDSRPIR